MKPLSKGETIWESYEKTWDNCTPIEGSQWVGRECLEKKHEYITEPELNRDCGEYCYEYFGM